MIDWGDGSPAQTLTAANFAMIGSPNGVTFVLNADHVYAEEGTYSYTITVTDPGGSTTLVGGSAIIADAPLIPRPDTATHGTTRASQCPRSPSGSFTDGNTDAPVD